VIAPGRDGQQGAADVHATDPADPAEGEDTGEAAREAHSAAQRSPISRDRRWFTVQAAPAPVGWNAWYRYPDAPLTAEPVVALLVQQLYPVNTAGFRSGGALGSRTVTAVVDNSGAVTTASSLPAFVAAYPGDVDAEQVDRWHPADAATTT
jgi:hypothetical protein